MLGPPAVSASALPRELRRPSGAQRRRVAAVRRQRVHLPALRPELFWGIHDETFAFAFVGLAFLFWLRGQFLASALMLALSATTKESLFLFMVSFSAVALVSHHRFHPAETAGSARRVFGVTGLLGLAGFAGYFFLQPLLLRKQFDHLNKLATLDTPLSPSVLSQKRIGRTYRRIGRTGALLGVEGGSRAGGEGR